MPLREGREGSPTAARLGASIFHLSVLTAEEEEGRGFPGLSIHHLTDHDGVVPGRDGLPHSAIDPTEGTLQKGGP